jgi:UDP-N-acetyl-D-galactosamine dehydrogenase
MSEPKFKIGVVGLGYVGLPLATLLAEKFSVVGFDLNMQRVAQIRAFSDPTFEVSKESLKAVVKTIDSEKNGLYCSSDPKYLAPVNFYIVCVPTPVTKDNEPDFSLLEKASAGLGSYLKKGDYVVYESTVYPGATEGICQPILEQCSGLKGKEDFYLGYSPERINPGDKNRKLKDILKITSGCSPASAAIIDQVYATVIEAGTYKSPSISVAEAAKVIENAQRDLNIAFVNELAIVFSKMGLNTHEVLKAAATKWNFMPFSPGLVGGHCIGVDPYYLAAKAKLVGHDPKVILAGRKLNNEMGAFVANQVLQMLALIKIGMPGTEVLLVGFSFKENCPDVRNTGVMSVYNALNSFGAKISVYDTVADKEAALNSYGVSLIKAPKKMGYQAIVLCVPHKELLAVDWRIYTTAKGVIYKVKEAFSTRADGQL